jgi:dihydroflavonol-4-reductase
MILITGATGHIGNVLVRELIGRGEKVRALVLPGDNLAPLAGLDVELVEGSVLEPDSLRRALRGVEVVYHLAGIISIMPGKETLVTRVNVQGTENMLEAARRAGVERLIYTSSIHAIHRVKEGVRIDERLPFDPENCAGEYDRSKARASLAVLKAVKEGLDAVIVCPTGVIGPYDYRLSEMGRLLLRSALSRVQWTVDGAYDFVDVRDVVRGEILARERGRTGQVYILSGEQIRLPRLVELSARAAGKRIFCIHIPRKIARAVSTLMPWYYRLTRTRPLFTPYSIETVLGNSVISHARACSELGYQPRPLCETVVDTMGWFREHGRLRFST